MIVAGCSDRVRPGPAGVTTAINLTVDVVAPRNAAQVAPGTTVTVVVHGNEPGARLTGLAFVARRFNSNALIDSVRISFPAMQDTSLQFPLRIPAGLQTNEQIDLWGVAFAANQQTRISQPRPILVLSCTNSPAC